MTSVALLCNQKNVSSDHKTIIFRLNQKSLNHFIVDSPIMFDVFVGKETGDFSPQFEQLDKLAIGDEITVYHAGKIPLQRNGDVRFNKTVQFIDKAGVAYFIRGSKDKYGGYLFIGLGVLLAIVVSILKKIGKIK